MVCFLLGWQETKVWLRIVDIDNPSSPETGLKIYAPQQAVCGPERTISNTFGCNQWELNFQAGLSLIGKSRLFTKRTLTGKFTVTGRRLIQVFIVAICHNSIDAVVR